MNLRHRPSADHLRIAELSGASACQPGDQELPSKYRAVVLVLFTSLLVSGCYPALKTEQPKLRVTVRDASGAPVPDAAFTLATYRYPFPTAASTTFAKFATDGAGEVRVPRRRDWLVQLALPDGIRSYDWAYCIEKPGYRAVAAVEPDFSEAVTVSLERSTTPSVCKWPAVDQSYYELTVGEP
jgi:hypothetical protein